MAATFYWHDYETWGAHPAFDKPVQFAGVRTDMDFNPVGEPLMIYCKPAPDFLPDPQSCLITGITPQLALEKGVTEKEFVAAIYRELAQPETCGVGFNSIRFDDEVSRYAFYRNFYDPYEREWKSGNSRWDIMDVLRMMRALRPDGIEWPNYEDGRPCFKLEEITKANALTHDAAHDALSDVYATIAVAKLIKTRQPKLFDYAFKLRDKRFAATLIDIENNKPLLHFSSRFPSENGNAALVLPLAFHPLNKNSVISINLMNDPSVLLSLSVEDLHARLFTPASELPEGAERLALKEIHLNKSPMLLPPNMLDEKTAESLKIDKTLCEKHWKFFYGLTSVEHQAILKKLEALYVDNPFPPAEDVEQMLYQGFLQDSDRYLLEQVRRLDECGLKSLKPAFLDSRLPELLFRYRARNFPTSLTEAEQQKWKDFCLMRLAKNRVNGELVDIDGYMTYLAGLLQQENLLNRDKAILNLLKDYAENLKAE
jgi:exodeoxyribonuclease-1